MTEPELDTRYSKERPRPSSERSEPTAGPSSEAKPSAEGDDTMTISDSDSESLSHSDLGTDVGHGH